MKKDNYFIMEIMILNQNVANIQVLVEQVVVLVKHRNKKII